jgi:hypothetical protein
LEVKRNEKNFSRLNNFKCGGKSCILAAGKLR